jgi:hypothetical protein
MCRWGTGRTPRLPAVAEKCPSGHAAQWMVLAANWPRLQAVQRSAHVNVRLHPPPRLVQAPLHLRLAAYVPLALLAASLDHCRLRGATRTLVARARTANVRKFSSSVIEPV